MDFRNYTDKLQELQSKHAEEISELRKEFAMSNQMYSKGDIIEDHLGRIEVDKVRWQVSCSRPDCPATIVYEGIMINKNGQFNKNGTKRIVWETNVLKEHKNDKVIRKAPGKHKK